MKMTKLSLVAALAVSAAFAGGDIAPVEPVVAAPAVADCNKDTTINGKAQAYYYTHDQGVNDLFDNDSTAIGTAVTLDVSHKLFDGVTANFTAVGYANLNDPQNLESGATGAFLNVANLTATYGDTTLIAGRQLIDSPMFGGFDWLLAPGAFEAYTLVNKSISDLTLVGTYVTKWRDNNDGTFGDGDEFTDLADDNYALGAVYGADALSASVWYYGIDAYGPAKYTEVYGDAGYDFGAFNVAAQIAATDYDAGDDSTAYGLKVGTEFSGINLMAAVSNVTDRAAGIVGRDTFYTTSWNTFASTVAVANDDTISWKVGASTEYAGINAEASYAGYGDDGSEFDLILGYDVTDSVNFGAIYTSTTANVANADAVNALELVGTYKF